MSRTNASTAIFKYLISPISLFALGWKTIDLNKTKIRADKEKRLVVCVLHTSAWDFVVLQLAAAYLKTQVHAVAKAGLTWLDKLLPLPAPLINLRKGQSTIEVVKQKASESEYFSVFVAPEGTRAHAAKWHKGWHVIAEALNANVLLIGLDFEKKHIVWDSILEITGDYEQDLKELQDRLIKYKPHDPSKCSLFDKAKL